MIMSTTEISFDEMLRTHGYIIYTCRGTSMMPLLRQRKDIVEIRPLTERAHKYDVVLYKRGDMYILHRVLKVLPDGYIIAGDHCVQVETDIKDEDILGVMTRVVRNGRSITPDHFFYKFYVHLWCDCYPVRMLILKIRQRIRKILNRKKRRET